MAAPNTPLSHFLPYVLPKARGCAEPYAEFQLRMAAIDFCERTRCWRHIITATVTATNRTLVAPSNTTIHEFEEVRHNGLLLTPTQYTDAEPPELTGTVKTGSPQYVSQAEPGIVSIFPYQAGTLKISAFLKPRHGQAYGADPSDPLRDAYNVVPEFMLTQHAETLAAGALARILSTPDEPYTDLAAASMYAGVFAQKASTHFARNMRGQDRAPIRTKPQWI